MARRAGLRNGYGGWIGCLVLLAGLLVSARPASATNYIEGSPFVIDGVDAGAYEG